METKRLKMVYPLLFSEICFPVTNTAQRNKVVSAIVSYIVINMMNMERSGVCLFSSTNAAGMIVAFPDFVTKVWGELFRIAFVETFSAFSCFYRNAGFAINMIVSTHYKANRLGYRLSTSSTRNGNSIVVPVIASALQPHFANIFTIACKTTKMIFDRFYVPVRTLKFFPAIIAVKYCSLLWLKRFSPMTRKKFPFSPALVVFFESITTATSTFNNWVIADYFHISSVSYGTNLSNTIFVPCWREVINNDV